VLGALLHGRQHYGVRRPVSPVRRRWSPGSGIRDRQDPAGAREHSGNRTHLDQFEPPLALRLAIGECSEGDAHLVAAKSEIPGLLGEYRSPYPLEVVE
jgi:hypothetical protein